MPIFLCREAAQQTVEDFGGKPCRTCRDDVAAVSDRQPSEETGGLWTVATDTGPSVPPPSDQLKSVRVNFEQRYQERTGNAPSVAAAQAYDAVRLISATLRKVGPNRTRLRDALAETRDFPGASGPVTFDHAGNDLSPLTLAPLR